MIEWFGQIADATAYIHSVKIIHRDIKTSAPFIKLSTETSISPQRDTKVDGSNMLKRRFHALLMTFW